MPLSVPPTDKRQVPCALSPPAVGQGLSPGFVGAGAGSGWQLGADGAVLRAAGKWAALRGRSHLPSPCALGVPTTVPREGTEVGSPLDPAQCLGPSSYRATSAAPLEPGSLTWWLLQWQ